MQSPWTFWTGTDEASIRRGMNNSMVVREDPDLSRGLHMVSKATLSLIVQTRREWLTWVAVAR